MPRSLPRRSLAATAVGALAVSGLALGPQPAGAIGPVVILLSQADRVASVRYDGTDSAVQLTAHRLDPSTTIGFEFNRDPRAGNAADGWTAVSGAPTMTGAYAQQVWEPPAGLVGRVGGAAGGRHRRRRQPSYSLRPNVVIAGPDDLEHSVSIGPGYAPFFPHAAGRGLHRHRLLRAALRRLGPHRHHDGGLGHHHRRDRLGRADVLEHRRTGPSAAGSAAAVRPTSLKAPDPDSGFTTTPGGAFAGVLDITPFAPAPGPCWPSPPSAAPTTSCPPRSYRQTDRVRADATPDASEVRAGERARVTVLSAFDSTSQPIAGAEVRRRSDSGLVGYTDGLGQVVARQPGGTTETYYVNTADSDAYTGGEDVQSSAVSIGTYTPVVTSLQLYSQDGLLFDRDEYTAGDLYLQVTDQQGRPFGEGEAVRFRSYRDGTTPPGYRTRTADSRGRVVVPFDSSVPAGDHRIDGRLASAAPSDPDQTVVLTIGDARLRLTPSESPVQRGIGGQIDYTGRLTMGGAPLTGRRISLRYLRGVEVVPGGRADAAVVQGRRRVLVRAVTTDDDGEFTFTVDDPARRPRASEIGGRLIAATANQPASATAVDGNAGARIISGTRFGTGRRGGVRVVLRGASNGARGDVLRVTAPTSVAGESVRLYRTAPGGRSLLATRRLNRAGDLPRVVVADRNGRALTTYVVQLVPSRRVLGSSSAPLRVG